MFLGEVTDIEILVHKDTLDVIVDKFGEKVKMKKEDEDFVRIYATVQVSPTFFAWCFTFGGKLKIMSPSYIVEKYFNLMIVLMDFYENNDIPICENVSE